MTNIIEIIETNFNRPFEWGQWDCAIFAMTCLAPDALDLLIDQYDTEQGAIDKIAELGGWDAKIAELGGVEIEVRNAFNGDLVKLKGHETVGIMQGGQIVVITTHGMKKMPKSNAEKAWRFSG